jgi:uncharacterized membrane protein (Fun14 family)
MKKLIMLLATVLLSSCATISGTVISPVTGLLHGFDAGWSINPVLSLPLAVVGSVISPIICFPVGIFADVCQFLAGYGDLTVYEWAFYIFLHTPKVF